MLNRFVTRFITWTTVIGATALVVALLMPLLLGVK